MTSFADNLVNNYLDHAVDLLHVEKDLQSKMVGHLVRLRKELLQKLKNVDPTGAYKTKHQQIRLKRLLGSADKSIKSTYKDLQKEHKEYLYDFSKVEANANIAIPNAVLGASIFSTSFSDTQLKTLSTNVLIQGAKSKDWWGRMERGSREAFSDEIRQGVLQGESLGTIVQRVRGKHTGKYMDMELKSGKIKKTGVFKGGVLDTGTRQAKSLARTSIQTVANEIRNETIQKQSKYVKGSQWVSTLDMRTTPLCMALDGHVWDLDWKPIDGGPAYPGVNPHWGCRSTTIPWMRSAAELLGVKGVPKTTRASMDGQVASKTTYGDWFDKQSPERQLEILGPGKLKRYKKNKLSFRDMIDGSGKPLTLAELDAKIAKKGFKPTPAHKVPTVPKSKVVKPALSKAELKAVEQKRFIDAQLAQTKVDLQDPLKPVTFIKGIPYDSLGLDGTKFKPVSAQDWKDIPDVDVGESPLKEIKGKQPSAGIIIEEADGRVWVYEPKNHYSNTEHTFAKGGQEKGLSLQQTAIKEAFEETGLEVEITGLLGDYERKTSHNRYYIGKRKAGDPSLAHWEADNVKLVPKEDVHKYLNKKTDKDLFNDYMRQEHVVDKYLEHIPNTQTGSNPGGKFKHTITGDEYYIKFYKDTEQAVSEAFANNLALEMKLGAPESVIRGVTVPENIMGQLGGPGRHPAIVSRWVDGLERLDLTKSNVSHQRQLAKHHMLAGLVEDWDVVGLNYDNLLNGPKNNIHVIDQGGAFKYRAQGGSKAYTATPDAFKTLLTMNPQAKAVFGPVYEQFTKKNGKPLAQWLNWILPDTKIRDIALQSGVTDLTLVNNLIARKHELIKQLKNLDKPNAGVKLGEKKQAIVSTKVDKKTIKKVVDSRVVGATIKGDRAMVEDANILFWQEKSAAGQIQTKARLKLTVEGSNTLTDNLNLTNDIPKISPIQSAADSVWQNIEAFAKTVGFHSNDGLYNHATLETAEKVKKLLDKKIKKPGTPDEKLWASHYMKVWKDIDKARRNQTKPKIHKRFIVPDLAEPKKTKTIRQVRAEKQDNLSIHKKETVKGRSQSTSTPIYNLRAEGYNLDFGDGDVATFIPFDRDTPFRGNDFALRGQLEMSMDGGFTKEKYDKFTTHLQKMGVDVAPPSKEYTELMYLKQGCHIHDWDSDSGFLNVYNDTTLTDVEKIEGIKEYLLNEYGVKTPNKTSTGIVGYNPQGVDNSFGEGWNKRYRWDIPVDKMEKEMSGYRLVHNSGTKIPVLVDQLLEGGGDFTSTTERLRKGVSISSGQSPGTDLNSGGASYLFTRIRKRKGYSYNPGFKFKIRNLARMDAISYDGDNYGRMTGNFKEDNMMNATIKKLKQCSNGRSNETMLKHGLNLLDEIEEITVKDNAEKLKVIGVFKKHGWTRLPDGRKVSDIVIVQSGESVEPWRTKK